MKVDSLAVGFVVEGLGDHTSAVVIWIHASLLCSQEVRPKEVAMVLWVPPAQDETGGVLEETPSPFFCPLAVPLPSYLASPVARPQEPHLSTSALSGDEFGWLHTPASGTAGCK